MYRPSEPAAPPTESYRSGGFDRDGLQDDWAAGRPADRGGDRRPRGADQHDRRLQAGRRGDQDGQGLAGIQFDRVFVEVCRGDDRARRGVGD